MEFKEFCRERDRMCERYDSCDSCPIHKLDKAGYSCTRICMNFPDEAERIVSEWTKEHPIITNADKFMEVFGKNSYFRQTSTKMFFCSGTIGLNGIEEEIIYQDWLEQEYKPPRKEDADES